MQDLVYQFLRGEKYLYNNLLPSKLDEIPKRKTFTDERDRALVYRYYFHAHLIRRNYQDCLYHLHQEFFLSDNFIVHLLTINMELLKDLSREKPNSKQLNREFPWFNWSVSS